MWEYIVLIEFEDGTRCVGWSQDERPLLGPALLDGEEIQIIGFDVWHNRYYVGTEGFTE